MCAIKSNASSHSLWEGNPKDVTSIAFPKNVTEAVAVLGRLVTAESAPPSVPVWRSDTESHAVDMSKKQLSKLPAAHDPLSPPIGAELSTSISPLPHVTSFTYAAVSRAKPSTAHATSVARIVPATPRMGQRGPEIGAARVAG
jgi:hypothetical protein